MESQNEGCLYLCGTPIGNLEDLTLRAIRILTEVDLIACEDTRQTIKLLNHLNLSKKMISYHEHNEKKRTDELVNLLLQGKKIALVSDAGTPAISDPGSEIVQKAIENSIRVIPIPGPSAFLLAVVCSGFDSSSFIFSGFLPKERNKRMAILEKIKNEERTTIIYESPHRLKNTLLEMNEILATRKICIARELTKKFEEFWRGSISDGLLYFSERQPKGEFCLVIEGKKNEEFSEDFYHQRLQELISLKFSKKEVSKILAKEFKISSKKIYEQLVQNLYKL